MLILTLTIDVDVLLAQALSFLLLGGGQAGNRNVKMRKSHGKLRIVSSNRQNAIAI